MLTAIEIGKRIAQARKQKGLSQAQVAQHLAISPQAVGKWERGESLPDIITLDRLALYLGISLNTFSESSSEHSIDDAHGLAAESEEQHTEAALQDGVLDAAGPPASEHVSSKKSATVEDEHQNLAQEDTLEVATDTTDVPKWDFSHGDWRDSDFSGLNNLAEKLKGSNIRNCQFVGSELQNLELTGSSVIDSSFQKADLSDALFKGCSIVRCNFDHAELNNAVFKGSSVIDCSFNAAALTAATIDGCSFKRCTMEDIALKNITFKATQLSGITFSGEVTACVFDNCAYSDTVFKDAHLTNTFFKGRGLKKIQLTNCTVDSITYVFLKNAKAKLNNVTIVD